MPRHILINYQQRPSIAWKERRRTYSTTSILHFHHQGSCLRSVQPKLTRLKLAATNTALYFLFCLIFLLNEIFSACFYLQIRVSVTISRLSYTHTQFVLFSMMKQQVISVQESCSEEWIASLCMIHLFFISMKMSFLRGGNCNWARWHHTWSYMSPSMIDPHPLITRNILFVPRG